MKNTLIVLTGPTGVGKTNLSIQFAKKYDCEIISADSMQIYKHLDIGTAKIKQSEMENIPHHMIDILTPDKSYSVAEYSKRVIDIIEDIIKRDRTPLLVGGTGLYIDGVIFKHDYSEVKPNFDLRDKLEKIYFKDNGLQLYNMLNEIDPITASNLCPNDKNRIIRAIEIYKISGIPKSKQKRVKRTVFNTLQLNTVLFVVNMDRNALYKNIDKRVDIMLSSGLVDEVRTLLNSGYSPNSQAFKAIGYKEVVDYLNGITDIQTMVKLIKQHSRNYAKRQLTWFRRNKEYNWIDKTDMDNTQILERMIKILKEQEYNGVSKECTIK